MTTLWLLQISFGCIVAGVVLILLSIEPLHKANKRTVKKASPVRKGRRRKDAANEGANRAGDPGISTDYLEQASLEEVRYSFIHPGKGPSGAPHWDMRVIKRCSYMLVAG